MKIILSQSQIDQVKDLYDQGFGEKRIAKKLNMTFGEVQKSYKILGISGKRPKDKIKSRIPDQKQCNVCLEIKKIDQFKVNFRKSSNWISAKCLPCEKEYHKTLNAHPIYKNKRKQYRATKSANSKRYIIIIPNETLNEIQILYDQGFGHVRIYKMLGLTISIVEKAYRVLGLKGKGKRSKDLLQSRRKPRPDKKQCKDCGQIKSSDQFRIVKKFYLDSRCLECAKEYRKKRQSTLQQKQHQRSYDVIRNQSSKRKEQRKQRSKEKWDNDINFRLRRMVSSVILYGLKKNNSDKNNESCLSHLPYTIEELKHHLENQFESWMTWKNHGKYNAKTWNDNDPSTWTWQMDHIICHSDLPYTSMEDENFKKCWALENLRPYSAKQNVLDGSKRTRHNNI